MKITLSGKNVVESHHHYLVIELSFTREDGDEKNDSLAIELASEIMEVVAGMIKPRICGLIIIYPAFVTGMDIVRQSDGRYSGCLTEEERSFVQALLVQTIDLLDLNIVREVGVCCKADSASLDAEIAASSNPSRVGKYTGPSTSSWASTARSEGWY